MRSRCLRLLALLTVLPLLLQVPAVGVSAGGGPTITSVTLSGSGADLQVAVNGSGFGPAPAVDGTASPYARQQPMPFTGDTPFLVVIDKTQAGWQAGCDNFLVSGGTGQPPCSGANNVGLVYQSWTDGQILIGGFGSTYGTNGWFVAPGDSMKVTVCSTASFSSCTSWTGALPACQPTISNVTPTTVPQGGTVGLRGCDVLGWGGSAGALQLTPTTSVATQGGVLQEAPLQIQQVHSLGGGSFSFTVPEDTLPAAYTLMAVDTGGRKSNGVPLSVVAAGTPSLPVSTHLDLLATDGGGAFAPLGSASPPVFTLVIGPETLTYVNYAPTPPPYANPGPPAAGASPGPYNWGTLTSQWWPAPPQVLASRSTEAVLPVVVGTGSCTGSVTFSILSWTDLVPVVTDSAAAADGSPDGSVGHWQTIKRKVFQGPGYDASGSCLVEGGNQSVRVTLHPGVNYLAFAGTQGGQTYSSLGPWGTFGAATSTGAPYTEVVVPALATVQLKAVPYSILYQPPGDQSTASLSRVITNTIQYGVGTSSQVSNNATDGTNTCGGLDLVVTIQGCQGQSQSTGNGFAEAQGSSLQQEAAASNSWPIGPVSGLVPGSYGDYWHEPFWYDNFVFLVNPEYAVFDAEGRPAYDLVPGQSLHTELVPVAFLAACAAGIAAPTGPGLPAYTDPCSVPGTNDLTAQEALSVLQLDPFYPEGQSFDPSTIVDANGQHRAQVPQISSPAYAENADLQGVSNLQSTTNSSYAGTANAVAESATISGQTTFGLDLKISKILAGELTATQTSASSSTYYTTVTYQASTAAAQENSQFYSDVEGDWDNHYNPTGKAPNCPGCHDPLQPEPQSQFTINLFQDNVFGGLMFQDPAAPPPPPDYKEQMPSMLPTILPGAAAETAAIRNFDLHPPCQPWPACLTGGSAGTGASGGAGSGSGGGLAASPFNDLEGYGWARGAIDGLAGADILRGVAPGRFDPEGDVTRAQFATLLDRLFHLPGPSQPTVFSDVPQGHWAYQAVEAASPFLSGTKSGAFAPDAAVSRQDVAAAVVGILAAEQRLTVSDASHAQAVLAGVPDAGGIAADLQRLVATAIQHGIMNGFPDGSFQPAGQLTRAQVAVLLDRVEQGLPATATPPAVTGVSPASGPAAGGTVVTVSGSGFTGATAVLFQGPGGTGVGPASGFTVASDEQITATAPAGPPGVTADVEVVTSAGISQPVVADRFTYLSESNASGGVVTQPLVTGVSPAGGPAAGGTIVTIAGLGFTGAMAIAFGGVAASSFTVVSDALVTATAPPGSGSVDITVTTPGGSSATGAADQFTYR